MSMEEERPSRQSLFAATGDGDRRRLLSLCAEDIEWMRFFRARVGPWPETRSAGMPDLENLLEMSRCEFEVAAGGTIHAGNGYGPPAAG